MKTINNILRIDASARREGSVTRDLTTKTVEHLSEKSAVQITVRDLANSLPFVDEAWIGANFTPEANRNTEQRNKLALSDSLVKELEAADTVLMGLPIYNFGIPAALKAWVDLIARVGRTFRYTENGPIGLLEGKRVIILVASGGTPMGSDIDFATSYLRHALKFVGITDVTFIAADGLGAKAEIKIAEAIRAISAL